MKIGERLVNEANATVVEFAGQPDAANLAANSLTTQWPEEKLAALLDWLETEPYLEELASPLLLAAIALLRAG